MISGAIAIPNTGTEKPYFTNGAVPVFSRAVYSSGESGGTTTSYVWYANGLGWVKGSDVSGHANPTALSQTDTMVTNGKYYADSGFLSELGRVQNVNFVVVNQSVVGNGTLTVSGDSLYGNRYLVNGESVLVTATASTSSRLLELTKNGTAITSGSSITASGADLNLIATFTRLNYVVKLQQPPANGMIEVKRLEQGVYVDKQFPLTVSYGDQLKFICTPNDGYVLGFISIDNQRFTTPTVEVTVNSTSSFGDINVFALFASRDSYVNNIHASAGGSVMVKNAAGENIPVTAEGDFSCIDGGVYKIIATPLTGKVLDGIYLNDRIISRTSPYVFTQPKYVQRFSVGFINESSHGVHIFCGGDTSTTETSWYGCTCSATNVGDVYTFTPNAATNYQFTCLYVEDLDGTGKGSVTMAAQGVTSITKTIDFNARVVAIFKNTSTPVEPIDEDQGGSPVASAATIGVWEGGESHLQAVWRSRRYVFMRPISFQSARVYAGAYDSNGPMLSLLQYSSPQMGDARKVSVMMANESPRRLPVHRMEKYVEIEVRGKAIILEVGVSTSMGGLCQPNT